ncbi:PadR family transcriptional regulator [Cohnella sp.]|uniref:PadR family transcriptional regulator n=1 Tax=Cohnella sp. TaxID=1883426 RepID=UPI00356840FB
MPKTKRSNLLALAVLSLLNEKTMHPYEIGVTMKQRGMSDTIKLNTGSLYAVIDHLIKNGLIESVETVKEGKHPERTIYRPTEKGKDELIDWLKCLLRTPTKEYPQFAAGLAFLGHLSPKEACDLLRERSIALTDRIEQARLSMEATLKMGIKRLFVIETEYELVLLEGEKSWLDRLIMEIEDGTLTERSGEQFVWKL